MVTKVYGKCDNTDIIFQYNEEKALWETVVPKDSDGEYVVEIYAEDEAGNVSYFAKVLFTVSIKGLCLDVKIIDISAEYSLDDVRALFGKSKYEMKARDEQYIATTNMNIFTADVVRCELCERW